MILLGGATRLSEAGLSIVEWKPLSGIIPPLNPEQWGIEFEHYKKFPEYALKHTTMTLSEFKFIFWMEYSHRLLGRLLGLVFIVPFLFFWRFFDDSMRKRAFLLLMLGCLQGGMGWFMVKSGLVKNPYVSHYRLAAHLFFALILYLGFMECLYQIGKEKKSYPLLIKPGHLKGTFFLVILTILYGAFTAGLRAGHMYNTFPLMGDSLIPGEFWFHTPLWINLFENPAAVQWIHRFLATLSLLAAVPLGIRLLKQGYRHESYLILGAVTLQYSLGILTVVHIVPPMLGVMHQGGAVLLMTILFVFILRTRSL